MKNPSKNNDGENQLNENRCNEKHQNKNQYHYRQPRQHKSNQLGNAQDKTQQDKPRLRQNAAPKSPVNRRSTKKTKTDVSGAAARPSMARMIEAVRKAEARRRADQEGRQEKREPNRERAQVTAGAKSEMSVSGVSDIPGRSDMSGKKDISGRSDISDLKTLTAQDKDKNEKKQAASGDNVKTAQVLKKAAEVARARKDVMPRAVSVVKGSAAVSVAHTTQRSEPSEAKKEANTKNALHGTKPSKRAQKWGSMTKRINRRMASPPAGQDVLLTPHQVKMAGKAAGPGGHLTTRQTRALRVAEAMRHLKEAAKQEPNQPKHTQAQKRLQETLDKIDLSNPQSPILLVALTHPSYTFESPNTNKENNQRLEFLGDAVLDFIVGEYLYLQFPDKSEGELTKIRAAVVNESTLAQAARSIRLGAALFLGRGEQVSGGRERASILADALEALIGAFYLEEGYSEARQFVLDLLVPIIDEVDQDHYGDFKTLLQEVAQHDERSVNYKILDELGPDHDKSFTAGVFVQGVLKGKGTGKTKKEAEQLAARLALENWEADA